MNAQLRHLLTVKDLSSEELRELLDTAHELKKKQKLGEREEPLLGKSLAMIFEKPSNRTRVSFEVGMFQLGGRAINIHAKEIQIGVRETVGDVAQTLSRYVDAVVFRAMRHGDIAEFAEYATVPVINGLSDLFHPCQAVADMLTIEEYKGDISQQKICYIGDGNNVCNSLANICEMLGAQFTVSCPEGFEPLGDSVTIERNPADAIEGADVVYTDTWCSMGQEAEAEERWKKFTGYSVTNELFESASEEAIFLHCLPVHRGQEVEESLFERFRSIVLDQAENRLHAQKAILTMLLQ